MWTHGKCWEQDTKVTSDLYSCHYCFFQYRCSVLGSLFLVGPWVSGGVWVIYTRIIKIRQWKSQFVSPTLPSCILPQIPVDILQVVVIFELAKGTESQVEVISTKRQEQQGFYGYLKKLQPLYGWHSFPVWAQVFHIQVHLGAAKTHWTFISWKGKKGKTLVFYLHKVKRCVQLCCFYSVCHLAWIIVLEGPAGRFCPRFVLFHDSRAYSISCTTQKRSWFHHDFHISN